MAGPSDRELEHQHAPRQRPASSGTQINRDDARDRLMLSISDALIFLLLDGTAYGGGARKIRKQITHNLTECNKDLLVASGIGHGRASGWRDQINVECEGELNRKLDQVQENIDRSERRRFWLFLSLGAVIGLLLSLLGR